MQVTSTPDSMGESDFEYELECVCREASLIITNEECKGDNMYYCKKCEKIQKYRGIKYCDCCGPMCHGPGNKKGHGFNVHSRDVVLVQKIIETEENDEKASLGKRILRAMVGTERANSIAKFIDKYDGPLMCVAATGTVLTIEILAELSADVTRHFLLSPVSAVSGIAAGALCIGEIVYYGYRLWNGDIETREFFRLTGRSVVKNSAIFGGALLGAKIGAVVGTVAGPAGLVCGVIAGFILGAALGVAVPKLYDIILDKIFPDKKADERKMEQELRKKMIREAISYFHYQAKDVENAKLFNEKELRKRFRAFALQAHPDRRDGDHSEWAILSQHYGILTALCKQRVGTKRMVQRKVLEIQAN